MLPNQETPRRSCREPTCRGSSGPWLIRLASPSARNMVATIYAKWISFSKNTLIACILRNARNDCIL